jgi:D-sedoheptulose 7-phosphate isomerase
MELEQMQQQILTHFKGHLETIAAMSEQLSNQIEEVTALQVKTLQAGGKILIAGNGGSAADAQHFAAELVGRFLLERRALPALALTTDSSILTAVGNDYGFEQIFSRQVEALASRGDLFIGISTSGNSENICRAVESARNLGCSTLSLVGGDGGRLANLSDLALVVPSSHTPYIQEGHLLLIHLLCDLVERQLFAQEP